MISSIPKSIINQFLLARIKNQEEAFLHSPYALEQQLQHAICDCDEAKAFDILSKINSLKRATLAPSPLRSLKNSLICSCTLFTRAAIQGGAMVETAFNLSDVYIQEIEKLEDIDSLAKLEYSMLAHFITLINEEKQPIYPHSVNRVIAYIHKHILQDLSLDGIAKAMFLHPNYLSHMFKKEVGITITEFINKKKIEESKYFLLHAESSISDIALLFGFCNQSYYTALFKKYTGITPNVFRNLETESANHGM